VAQLTAIHIFAASNAINAVEFWSELFFSSSCSTRISASLVSNGSVAGTGAGTDTDTDTDTEGKTGGASADAAGHGPLCGAAKVVGRGDSPSSKTGGRARFRFWVMKCVVLV